MSPTINIDVLNVIFRSDSHPNIYELKNCIKAFFYGYLSINGKDPELSFTLLEELLNNIEGFF